MGDGEKTKFFFFIQRLLPLLLLALLPVAFYLRTLPFELTYLDDQALIGPNFSVISSVSLGDIFTSDPFFSARPAFYRPLLNFSYWLDYHLFGSSWAAFHWHNIILNSLAAVLLFVFLRHLGFKKKASWFAAAIFSLHPALLPAVAWLPGRNDLLLTVFSLASALCFLRFQKDYRSWALAGHLFFWLLAVFSKETAIFLPLIFCLFIPGLLDLRKWRENIFSASFLVPVLLWFAGGLFYWLIRHGVLYSSVPYKVTDLFVGFWQGVSALLVFWGKFFWPFNLSTLPVYADSSIWPGIIILIFFSLALWKFWNRLNRPALFFGGFWFFLLLAPAVLLQNNPEYGVSFNLEHRLYLPAIGLLIMVLSFPSLKRRFASGLFLLFLSLAIIISSVRVNDFSTSFTFWQKAASSSPSSAFAQNNLGVMYYLSGQEDEALNHYIQALILNPQEKLARNNIGLYLMKRGYLAPAAAYFQSELSINPGYENTIANLQLLQGYQATQKKKKNN